jgi:hypothetical protein
MRMGALVRPHLFEGGCFDSRKDESLTAGRSLQAPGVSALSRWGWFIATLILLALWR